MWIQLSANSIYPLPTLTSAASSPVLAVFSVDIVFTDSVIGFTVGDITVSGGTLSNFAGSGDTYSVDVTPNFGTDTSVTVSVAADVCANAEGLLNKASNVLSYDVPGMYDTFTDADSTSLDAHSTDWGGGAWIEVAGNWSITGNQTLTTAVLNARSTNLVSFQPSDIRANFRTGTNLAASILFRGVDTTNFWLATLNDSANTVRLQEITAGSFVDRDSYSLSINGSTYYDVRVVDNGITMTVYVNGAATATYISIAKNTGKNVGVYASNNANARFDELLVI